MGGLAGGGGAPSIQPSTANSAFKNVNRFTSNLGGFGSATSGKYLIPGRHGNKEVRTTSQLDPTLNNARGYAAQGLGQQLQALNKTPEQSLADINNGTNAYYNLNAELNKRMADEAAANAQMQFSKTGLDNSTAYGAFAGKLATDNILRDLATRSQAIDQQHQMALNAVGANQNVLGGLASILGAPFQMSNNNLYNGFQAQDQMAMFNTQQKNQIAMENAQLQANAQARQQAGLGSLIGTGIGLATKAFTGGASAIPMALGGASSPSGFAGIPSVASNDPIHLANPNSWIYGGPVYGA